MPSKHWQCGYFNRERKINLEKECETKKLAKLSEFLGDLDGQFMAILHNMRLLKDRIERQESNERKNR